MICFESLSRVRVPSLESVWNHFTLAIRGNGEMWSLQVIATTSPHRPCASQKSGDAGSVATRPCSMTGFGLQRQSASASIRRRLCPAVLAMLRLSCRRFVKKDCIDRFAKSDHPICPSEVPQLRNNLGKRWKNVATTTIDITRGVLLVLPPGLVNLAQIACCASSSRELSMRHSMAF